MNELWFWFATRRKPDVIGVSPVGGVRWSDLSCALVELKPATRTQQVLPVGPEKRAFAYIQAKVWPVQRC